MTTNLDTLVSDRTYLTPQWLERSFVLAAQHPRRLRSVFPLPQTREFRIRMAQALEETGAATAD